MGPRLGRVEYVIALGRLFVPICSFNGATLRTRGIQSTSQLLTLETASASMGPRLGRVEYDLIVMHH